MTAANISPNAYKWRLTLNDGAIIDEHHSLNVRDFTNAKAISLILNIEWGAQCTERQPLRPSIEVGIPKDMTPLYFRRVTQQLGQKLTVVSLMFNIGYVQPDGLRCMIQLDPTSGLCTPFEERV